VVPQCSSSIRRNFREHLVFRGFQGNFSLGAQAEWRYYRSWVDKIGVEWSSREPLNQISPPVYLLFAAPDSGFQAGGPDKGISLNNRARLQCSPWLSWIEI
jgi:hypothetical protein